jgi:hypothetical protein
MSFPRGHGPWERVFAVKSNAAPSARRGGARILFPIDCNSLLERNGTPVNRISGNCAARVIQFPRRGSEQSVRIPSHRLDTPFIRRADPAPAAQELERLRGKRLAGEPTAGWGATI